MPERLPETGLPPQHSPQRPGLLLEMMTATTALLALLFGLTLYGFSYFNDPLQHAGAVQDQDRYLNLRLLGALRTFEAGIVAADAGNEGLDTATLENTLLAGVPECAAVWQKQPPAWLRQWNAWRGTPLLVKTPVQSLAAQLPLLQQQLQTLAAPGNRRMAQAPQLDIGRWLAAVRQRLQPPLPEETVGALPALQVQCSDIPLALATLLRDNAQLLHQLDWRDTTGASELKRWLAGQQVAVAARVIAQYNPWRGLPGCVYLRDSRNPALRPYLTDSRSSNRAICEQAEIIGNGEEALPQQTSPLVASSGTGEVIPSLNTLIAPLDTFRQPFGALYRQLTTTADDSNGAATRNQAQLKGAPVDVGFSVDLSLDVPTQALAQQVAACYTGQQAACQQLQVLRQSDKDQPIGHQLLESALVRMAGVAIIDIPTGRIEALAGALSPCTRQEHDGPGRDFQCDKRLPWPARYRPDALLNPAVFQDVMPASTIKPIMAAAFLSDGAAGASLLAQEQAQRRGQIQKQVQAQTQNQNQAQAQPATTLPQSGLRHELMHSNSAAFLNRMFCAPAFKDCQRPWQVQTSAIRLGWNAACGGGNRACGKRDLLSGRSLESTGNPENLAQPAQPIYPVTYGRLLAAPETSPPHTGKPASPRTPAAFALMPQEALDSELIAHCAAGADGRLGSRDDWQKCRGGQAVDIVAEGWGQGHARTTPLGVAGMMAMLGAAANGLPTFQPPHLVEAIHGVHFRQRWDLAPALPMPLGREAAGVILDGLSYSHRGGTATLACQEVLDNKTCTRIDWLAGKTGTPTFRNDGWPLDKIAEWCRTHPNQSSLNPVTGRLETQGSQGVPDCSSLRPYKWYTAVYRLDDGKDGATSGKPPLWQKAIAVLTERNWQRESGLVHGAGDRGPNPAAEIALQIVLRQRALASTARTP